MDRARSGIDDLLRLILTSRVDVVAHETPLEPAIRVVGVEPYEADAMYQSLAADHRVVLDRVGIFAGGEPDLLIC